MTKLETYLKEVSERAEAATPGPWVAYANMPFNVDLQKPRPSLSKHDAVKPTYWHPHDALFVLHARTDIPTLLKIIKRMKIQRNRYIGFRNPSYEQLVELEDSVLEAIIEGDVK